MEKLGKALVVLDTISIIFILNKIIIFKEDTVKWKCVMMEH